MASASYSYLLSLLQYICDFFRVFRQEFRDALLASPVPVYTPSRGRWRHRTRGREGGAESMLLPLIAVSLRPRPAAVRLQQRAPFVAGCDGSPWTEEETWALVDSTPAFTAGQGKNSATFWTALVASNAVLCQRSPSECMERAAELAAVQNTTMQLFGREPVVRRFTSRTRVPATHIPCGPRTPSHELHLMNTISAGPGRLEPTA